ncbi:MAG TPA: hypothetical protein VH044_14255 [Polyangiaceae bacterium]|jgi:hypothetical protein|nr:hypothetical protein [Polyangiaceae bacterium]
MLLEAILTKTDLDRVLGHAVPAEIQIGDDGNLVLDQPREARLVPDVGLRVAVRAKLHWPVMGLHLPVDIDPLTLLMQPFVERRPEGDALVFKLKVEDADIALSPKIIDDRITAHINHELVEKRVELSWNFQTTLSRAFELPASIRSSSAVILDVKHGVVKVTEDAIAFGVSFDTAVRRRGDFAPRRFSVDSGAGSSLNGAAKTEGALALAAGRPPPASVNARPRGALVAAGAFAGLALLVGFGVGRRFAV